MLCICCAHTQANTTGVTGGAAALTVSMSLRAYGNYDILRGLLKVLAMLTL
jgi:hypothetical protein